jgi:poly(3-hydroxybutyrate) depolymerase
VRPSAAFVLATAFAVGCGRSSLDEGPSDTGTKDGATSARDTSSTPDATALRAGCGKPLPAGQPKTVPGTPQGYLHYTVMGTGATLAGSVPGNAGPITFWVRVPADYDPSRAYRVVYIGGGCDAPGTANMDTYQLYLEAKGGSEEAIYVALDTPPTQAVSCYDTASGTSSPEWEAFQLIHTVVDQTYCVDDDQVFASGFSGGGVLASMWGCYFAGDGEHPWNGVPGGSAGAAPRLFAPRYHLRGQASVAFDDPVDEPPCNGPIAALFITVPTPGGNGTTSTSGLARVLKMNGCDTTSPPVAWHPDVFGLASCIQYATCPHAYPVVMCPRTSNQTDQQNLAIPAFRHLFDDATAPP